MILMHNVFLNAKRFLGQRLDETADSFNESRICFHLVKDIGPITLSSIS